jgi:hypothetical protein
LGEPTAVLADIWATVPALEMNAIPPTAIAARLAIIIGL